LHGAWVRSSTGYYARFNLAMDRSLGFGLCACHITIKIVLLDKSSKTNFKVCAG
jgi:hypothetical protein